MEHFADNDVVIISACRTALGSFGGQFLNIPATELGAFCIKEVIKPLKSEKEVQECIMGNVISSGLRQAPCRQAALQGGLDKGVVCTTVNKVCASGLKAIMLGCQQIQHSGCGGQKKSVVVCGGFENMSRIPYYISSARFGSKMGDQKLLDGLLTDGLLNPFNGTHMGIGAELAAKKFNITREDQDNYAISSIKRAMAAQSRGAFVKEIVPIKSKGKGGESVFIRTDEELQKSQNFEKLRKLSPVFQKEDGTVTAANASIISDGAAAVLLTSGRYARENGLPVLARVLSSADAEQDPMEFPWTPVIAMKKCLEASGISIDTVDTFEINEAFSVVPLVNAKILGIDLAKVNRNGGSVSLGHPLGCSGARLVVSILSQFAEDTKIRLGMAAICYGGGGASAMLIERVSSHPKKSAL